MKLKIHLSYIENNLIRQINRNSTGIITVPKYLPNWKWIGDIQLMERRTWHATQKATGFQKLGLSLENWMNNLPNSMG